jgi:pimeloyl-ACP methyl ester carboxylesterase
MAGSTLVIRNTCNNQALPYMNLIDSLKMIGPLSLLLATGACSNSQLQQSAAGSGPRPATQREGGTVSAQPQQGPGSNVYNHGSYTKNSYSSGGTRYWIYEPAAPVPRSAPVILYLHGFGEDDPAKYQDMFVHFARKGYLIIFPAMGGWGDVKLYQQNSTTAFKNALALLQTGNHVRPEPGKVVYAGHSLGTDVGLRMANDFRDKSFPKPLALVLHEGAGEQIVHNDLPLDELSHIGPNTLLIMISMVDWDQIDNSKSVVLKAWRNTPQIPVAGKNVIGIPSASHGSVTLVSDHVGVQSGKRNWWDPDLPLDGIDWWGYWRPTEAVLDYVFHGTHKEYFLGDGALVRDMANWGDGTPVSKKKTARDYPILSRAR